MGLSFRLSAGLFFFVAMWYITCTSEMRVDRNAYPGDPGSDPLRERYLESKG